MGFDAVRFALIAACLFGITSAFFSYGDWRRERDELIVILRDAGLERRGSDVIRRIETERTSHHAQILAARALVHDVMHARGEVDPLGSGAATAAGEATALDIGSPQWERALERLPVAVDLAKRAMEAQPNSWQAAMLIGAAVYLERSSRRDRRLYTQARDWEEPLAQAIASAPGQAEPRRVLAAAYLEVWPALSTAKQTRTRELLRDAFVYDDEAFRILLPAWLDHATDLDDAFHVIPDRPVAWRALERVFAERRDWEAFCRAHVRRLDAHVVESETLLAEAEERLRLGEFFHSRSLLLNVVASAPLDVRFAPFVARAFERYPSGLHGLASSEPLHEWLRWSLELDALGRSPLPSGVVGRLAGVAGQLDPSEAATAALVGGELYHAERLEKMAETLSVKDWGPYLVTKTRFFLDRGQIDDAVRTLDQVDRATRETMGFAFVREALARARGDLVELAAAERELAAFRRGEWSAAEWSFTGYRASLWILPDAPASTLTLGLNRVPPAGSVIEVRWDGTTVALRGVRADGDVEVVVPVDLEPHLLEVRVLAGEQLFPGRVRLELG